MVKQDNKTITVLVSLAVIAIIVVSLIGALATESNKRTTYSSVSSESKSVSAAAACPSRAVNESYVYTVTNNPTGWKTQDCPLTGFVLTNSSGSVFVADTDYTLTASTGTYTLKNTALVNRTCATDNVTLVSYNYCGEGYVNSSWGRSLLNNTPGFVVLALLVVVIAGALTLLSKEKED